MDLVGAAEEIVPAQSFTWEISQLSRETSSCKFSQVRQIERVYPLAKSLEAITWRFVESKVTSFVPLKVPLQSPASAIEQLVIGQFDVSVLLKNASHEVNPEACGTAYTLSLSLKVVWKFVGDGPDDKVLRQLGCYFTVHTADFTVIPKFSHSITNYSSYPLTSAVLMVIVKPDAVTRVLVEAIVPEEPNKVQVYIAQFTGLVFKNRVLAVKPISLVVPELTYNRS